MWPAEALAAPAERPLRLCPRAQVVAHLQAALAGAHGAAGAHCIHELWMRGEWPERIENALESLWKQAARSIPEWLPMRYVHWLPQVYEVAGGFRATRRGRTNVYLVLLDYSDRASDPHGVYVGMSHYRPAQRFDQHKAGIRAAGCVLKRGLEVLAGPTLHLQQIARGEGVRIEAELAVALAQTGLHVEGGH